MTFALRSGSIWWKLSLALLPLLGLRPTTPLPTFGCLEMGPWNGFLGVVQHVTFERQDYPIKAKSHIRRILQPYKYLARMSKKDISLCHSVVQSAKTYIRTEAGVIRIRDGKRQECGALCVKGLIWYEEESMNKAVGKIQRIISCFLQQPQKTKTKSLNGAGS